MLIRLVRRNQLSLRVFMRHGKWDRAAIVMCCHKLCLAKRPALPTHARDLVRAMQPEPCCITLQVVLRDVQICPPALTSVVL